MHKTLPLLCALTASLLIPALASPGVLTGQASVIDGDTLEIRGTRVRLHGIDAPEGRQSCQHPTRGVWRCGQQAALALDDLIARRPVQCTRRDTDRYGRMVAECSVSGTSLNRWMVRNGWATAYRQYSTSYVSDERQAKAERLNVWSGEFVDPGQFRRTGGKPPQAAPSGCRIKGNISSSGERIYHSPGQRDYERTRIDTSKGERWFCSGAEASRAGWRPASR